MSHTCCLSNTPECVSKCHEIHGGTGASRRSGHKSDMACANTHMQGSLCSVAPLCSTTHFSSPPSSPAWPVLRHAHQRLLPCAISGTQCEHAAATLRSGLQQRCTAAVPGGSLHVALAGAADEAAHTRRCAACGLDALRYAGGASTGRHCTGAACTLAHVGACLQPVLARAHVRAWVAVPAVVRQSLAAAATARGRLRVLARALPSAAVLRLEVAAQLGAPSAPRALHRAQRFQTRPSVKAEWR